MLSTDKRCSMQEAIKDAVHPGASILIEGFTHLISFAAAHEIIRQNIKGLTALRLTPDLVYDQLLQAGCIKKLIFSWAGNPGAGSLHAFRRALENKKNQTEVALEIEEYSHFGLLARLLAASAGLPFWPLHNYTGTDIPSNNSNIKSVICPYTGKELSTVPAFHPDVSIIHCQRADRMGNAQIWGLLGSQKEAAFAAKKVIIIAEEIVETSVIRSDPNRTIIPEMVVHYVVHEPFGAHPSYAQGYYDRDNDFYVQWEEISKHSENYHDYLEEFVYGCKDRAAYLAKLGTKKMEQLRAKSKYCAGVDYGY